MTRRLVLTDSADSKPQTGLQDALANDAIRLARTILQYRKSLVAATLGLAIVAAIISLLIPPTYTSHATLLPTGKVDKMAELKSLAGLGNLTTQDESSSELFPTILQSRAVAEGVLCHVYQVQEGWSITAVRLNDYFKLSNPDRLRQALAGVVSIDKDKKTGVIALAVETTSPELSQQVAQQYIEQLDQFNTYKRRTQARERARYLEHQVTNCAGQLRAAEDSLEAFQSVNRNWVGGDDPEVGKIVARLSREVEIQTQGYAYLRQQLEMAKLDAQKDIPVVSVLDTPSLPVIRTSPRRTLMTAVGGLVGFITMLIWIMMREYWLGTRNQASAQAMRDLSDELALAIRWRRRPVVHSANQSTESVHTP